MIYIFRIRPLARFLLACLVGFVGLQTVEMGMLVSSVVLMLYGVVLLMLAALMLPHLGAILFAWFSTWRWR